MKGNAQKTRRVNTAHFYFERIDGRELLVESFSLRYQVYCCERNFLPKDDFPSGQEEDRYDASSLHFAAFSMSDEMVGTVRLVRPGDMDLPLFSFCNLFDGVLPLDFTDDNVAEISRLAVSKSYRRRVEDGLYGLANAEDPKPKKIDARLRRSRPEIVLGLYKAMYQESKRQGIKYWLAAMEDSLETLLSRFCFEFQPAGPEVDYYGSVTPFFADISKIEKAVYQLRPELFREFVDGLEPEFQPIIALGGKD